ncbi:hypothetical protein B0J15DRAFT_16646 [Fusarium solani]|jgi:hypothetical protein|uniref:Transmembrane protein n=1 Tax=Fusarium solani TaxID=169388 RepID=A0A9P9L5Z9_FUSSL|nr:uncharacterized protein B0J15DRAFT_16646 [Fusarium solani]KAH7275460.1 hypothetical protein B0J15DRAFT_16646 [Fusarium solani]
MPGGRKPLLPMSFVYAMDATLPVCPSAPPRTSRETTHPTFSLLFFVSVSTGEDDFSRSSMGSAGSSYIHYFIHVILSVSFLLLFSSFFTYLPTYLFSSPSRGRSRSLRRQWFSQTIQATPFFVYVFIRQLCLLRCGQLAFRSFRMLGHVAFT